MIILNNYVHNLFIKSFKSKTVKLRSIERKPLINAVLFVWKQFKKLYQYALNPILSTLNILQHNNCIAFWLLKFYYPSFKNNVTRKIVFRPLLKKIPTLNFF